MSAPASTPAITASPVRSRGRICPSMGSDRRRCWTVRLRGKPLDPRVVKVEHFECDPCSRTGPHVPEEEAGDPRRRRRGPRRRGRRDRRLPGAERGRQDHHAAHADNAARADGRHRHGGRLRPAHRPGGCPSSDRLRLPERLHRARGTGRGGGRRPRPPVRHGDRRGDRPRAAAVRRARPRGAVGAQAQGDVRWPAPSARHRDGPRARARTPLPRRADHWPGPAGASQPLAAHQRAAGGAGDDGLPHHPLPRRGRRAVRPHPRHRPRLDRRLGHAGPAEVRRRRRRPHGHRGHRRAGGGGGSAGRRAAGRGDAAGERRPGDRPGTPRWRRTGAVGPRAGHRGGGGRRDREPPSQPGRRLPRPDRSLVAGGGRGADGPRRRPGAGRSAAMTAPAMGSNVARDTWTIFARAMRLSLRNPAWLVISLMQPILYILLFGPLLKPLSGQLGSGNAYQIFVPGILVQLGIFGALFVGFGLIAEWRAGVIESQRVTPASRTALLLGRVLRDVLVLLVQGTVLVLVSLLLGLRAPVLGVVLTLVVIALLGAAFSAVSYALALTLKSEDAFAPLLNAFVLPVLLLSGILLPMSLAPGWLQGISDVNPLKHVVEGARSFFTGDYTSGTAWWGLGLTVVLAVLGWWFGVRRFKRESG